MTDPSDDLADEAPTADAGGDDRAGTTGARGSVSAGALAGLCVLAAASIVVAVLDHRWDDFEDSAAESVMVAVILCAYLVAGWIGSRDTAMPLRDGALAASLSFALWIPLRVLVWVVRDDQRGLLSGDDPVFTVGAVMAQLLLAAGFGLLGAYVARRYAQRRG